MVDTSDFFAPYPSPEVAFPQSPQTKHAQPGDDTLDPYLLSPTRDFVSRGTDLPDHSSSGLSFMTSEESQPHGTEQEIFSIGDVQVDDPAFNPDDDMDLSGMRYQHYYGN
jgi:hypothetical protein